MKSNVVFKVIGVVLFFTAITFLIIQVVDFFRIPASYDSEMKYTSIDFIEYKESGIRKILAGLLFNHFFLSDFLKCF